MKKEYDFSKAKRGTVIPQKGKTRISIYIDDEILKEFRIRADQSGRGYQTMIVTIQHKPGHWDEQSAKTKRSLSHQRPTVCFSGCLIYILLFYRTILLLCRNGRYRKPFAELSAF